MDDHVRGSVLVVDDEPTIAEVVARYLERAGYETRIAADGVAAIDAAISARPDLVVLDLMLPGIDGLEVMRRLREQDRGTPVILLTAKGEESDRVIGLRLGADDYVVKPFSPAELVARVDAVLRRVDTSPAHETPIEFDDMTINPAARRVVVRRFPLLRRRRNRIARPARKRRSADRGHHHRLDELCQAAGGREHVR